MDGIGRAANEIGCNVLVVTLVNTASVRNQQEPGCCTGTCCRNIGHFQGSDTVVSFCALRRSEG